MADYRLANPFKLFDAAADFTATAANIAEKQLEDKARSDLMHMQAQTELAANDFLNELKQSNDYENWNKKVDEFLTRQGDMLQKNSKNTYTAKKAYEMMLSYRTNLMQRVENERLLKMMEDMNVQDTNTRAIYENLPPSQQRLDAQNATFDEAYRTGRMSETQWNANIIANTYKTESDNLINIGESKIKEIIANGGTEEDLISFVKNHKTEFKANSQYGNFDNVINHEKIEESALPVLRDRYKQVLNEEQAQNANKLSEIYTKTLNASYTPEQRKSFCLQGQAELQRMSGNRLAENDRIRYSKLFEIGIDEINNPSRATNKSGNKELINWIKDNADAYINAWRNGRYSNAYAMQQALHNAYQQQLDSYSDLSDEERQDLYLNGQIIISNVVKAAADTVYKEYPDLQKQVDNLAKESLKGLYTEEASSYIMKFLLDKIAESNVKYFDVNKLQDEINKKKNYLTNDGLNQLRLATDKKGKSKYEYKNQKDIGKLFDTINENDFTFTDVYGNRQTVQGADDILNAEGGYVQTGKGIIAKFLNLSPEEMRRIKDRETVEENDLKSERTFSYKGVDYRFRPKKNDKGKVIDYELYNAKTGEVLANGDTLKKIDKYGYMLDNPTDKNLEKMNITRSNWNKKTVKEKIDLITQSKL